jgi:hypothetical protein
MKIVSNYNIISLNLAICLNKSSESAVIFIVFFEFDRIMTISYPYSSRKNSRPASDAAVLTDSHWYESGIICGNTPWFIDYLTICSIIDEIAPRFG